MSAAMVSLLAILSGLFLSFQQRPPELPKISPLCGKLVHMERVLKKGSTDKYVAKTSPIPDALLQLFPFHEDEDCCAPASPSAETKTGRAGKFEFHKLAIGDYWLVIHLDDRVLKMAFRYPAARPPDDTCSQAWFAVHDSGRITLMRGHEE